MGKSIPSATTPKFLSLGRRPFLVLKPTPNSTTSGKVSKKESEMEAASNSRETTPSTHVIPGTANVNASSNIAMSSASSGNGNGGTVRIPLREVVSDYVKRWFKETLKEAKNGDINMQVLAGQMYYNGYGVPRDAQKGRMWISRASKTRSTVWKVGEKRPGYNASDSDSEEIMDDS